MNRLHILPAALLLAAAPLFAQTQGVSHPDAIEPEITVAAMDPAPAPSPAASSDAKPSPDVSASAAPDVPTATAKPLSDPDSDVVDYVPSAPNELPIGTLIKVRMSQTVSTKSTLTGTPFTAYLSEPVERNGKVVIPAGAELHGTVEDVHGGARFFGRASLRLQADQILLPDGSHYIINAQVIDTDQFHSTQIGSKGSIVRSDHVKATSVIAALTIGSAAAAGAVFGGTPGALIGAGAGAALTSAHWLRQDSETRLPVEGRVIFSLTTSMPMTPLH
jgi:hypothetical protein